LILNGVGRGLGYLNNVLALVLFSWQYQGTCLVIEDLAVKALKNFKSLISPPMYMGRSFEEWWSTAPLELKQKARKGDEGNKPLLNQINYVLLHLHLSGKHDLKPTHEELKDWLHSGQVDVMRMEKKK